MRRILSSFAVCGAVLLANGAVKADDKPIKDLPSAQVTQPSSTVPAANGPNGQVQQPMQMQPSYQQNGQWYTQNGQPQYMGRQDPSIRTSNYSPSGSYMASSSPCGCNSSYGANYTQSGYTVPTGSYPASYDGSNGYYMNGGYVNFGSGYDDRGRRNGRGLRNRERRGQ